MVILQHFVSHFWEKLKGVHMEQMGMYSMRVFSSKIRSNYAVKRSPRHRRTMCGLQRESERRRNLNALSCAHTVCSFTGVYAPNLASSLCESLLSLSLYLPLRFRLWESTYLPSRGGKFPRCLLVNTGFIVDEFITLLQPRRN